MNKVKFKPESSEGHLVLTRGIGSEGTPSAMGRWLEALLILLSHRAHMYHDTDQNHRIMFRRTISYYVLMQVRCPNSESPRSEPEPNPRTLGTAKHVTFKEIVVCLATN